MPTSQYLAFGTGVGANVYSYAVYSASAVRTTGYQPGLADAQHVNSVLKQTSVASAGVAMLATTYGLLDMLDDGSPSNFMLGVKSALDQIIGAQKFWVPGDIKGTLLATVPAGWLKADGALVSRAAYPALFTAIGTTYGAGDGSTTFRLPDLRGEFLRGADDGRGVDAGRSLGSAQAGMLEAHTHQLRVFSRSIDGGADEGDDTVSSVSGLVDGFIGSTGGTETRPRNVAVMWLIRAI